ncbi:hypothetical protein M1O52_03280, partial [Dehalococcoidia bacterium]|nr:hypothetical protein [Dehalococcoidia bacterium]
RWGRLSRNLSLAKQGAGTKISLNVRGINPGCLLQAGWAVAHDGFFARLEEMGVWTHRCGSHYNCYGKLGIPLRHSPVGLT